MSAEPQLRAVEDPHTPWVWWRMNGFQLEVCHGTSIVAHWEPFPRSAFDHPRQTPERRAVWLDLFLNPCVADA